jgi:adenylate kinase family enzyme
MQRVLIAGMGGSGKTTLARRLGPALGLPVHVLDDLYYGPGLVMAATFPDDIERIAAGDAWLFDSPGPPAESAAPTEVKDLLWARADTLVWLDYPRWLVVSRAVRRSLRRIVTREQLWHGYRETPLSWRRPDHPIRRAWRLHRIRREQLTARTQHPSWAHLQVIRHRSPQETAAWLSAIERRL